MMDLNAYKSLTENIHVPAGLNEAVLQAAQERKTPLRRTKPLLRVAVCAICAVALAAGSVKLQGGENTPAQSKTEREYTLGLTVSAAGYGANGGLILRTETVQDTAELDETIQTLTVTDADGVEVTGDYYLTVETLRAFVQEDGGTVLIPALSGDDAAGETALYAAPADSRWLQWPVAGSSTVSLSHAFGRSETPAGTVFHAGIDIPGQQERAITAAADGTVKETGFDPQRGNYLVLDHGGGLETVYAQCHSLTASVGDIVAAGDTIALLGSTGMSTGPHLCFQVWQNGTAQNPVAYFDRALRDTLSMA